jgi:integrase
VFSRNETFIDPEHFIKWMALPLLKKATEGGIRRFHDLRHFFVSMLIDQGDSAKYIQDHVGHASITMTIDTYRHLMPQAMKESTVKLEKSHFGGVQNPPISNPFARMEDHDKQDKVN